MRPVRLIHSCYSVKIVKMSLLYELMGIDSRLIAHIMFVIYRHTVYKATVTFYRYEVRSGQSV